MVQQCILRGILCATVMRFVISKLVNTFDAFNYVLLLLKRLFGDFHIKRAANYYNCVLLFEKKRNPM